MSRASATRWLVVLMQLPIVAALALMPAREAVAQDQYDPPGRVARLSYLRGLVSFQPAGESEWVMAIANRPLTTGDRLWTDDGARVELGTGSATIRLDARTDLSFLNVDDRTIQLQLTQGTITVRVQRLRRDEVVEVDTPNQAFSILRPGSYRVEASEDGLSTVVTVREGEGEASGGGATYTVGSGQSTRFTGTDYLDAVNLRMSRADEFDAWGQSRDRRSDTSLSARYVSHDVVGYEDLDDYGTWRTVPSYGNVWIPARVGPGWAPYREGHWVWISPWGYTWVDDAPWGYAPFHYGRWVTIDGRWGWIPGPAAVQAVYAPALVVFIGGPSFALSLSVGGGGSRAEVGWFPLGPREVYVPGYHVSRAYVDRVNVTNTTVSTTTITNVYDTQVTNVYRTTNVQYVNRTAPGGVTVVPQQAFTSAQPVARAAVPVNAQRIASAPVAPTAAATPTRNSVLGASVSRGGSAPRPPAAVATRSVVAKAPPPPPPVPFAQQQRALEEHPGLPLARKEVESVRPPAAATPQPSVRRAPPGRPATARDDRTPAAPPSTPSQRPPSTEGVRPPTAPPSPSPAAGAAQQPIQPRPPERAAQPPAPPKAPERAAQPPAPPKPPERAAQPPAPPRPPERAAQPSPPPKPPERAAQPSPPPKPAERAAQPSPPPKPPERAAQPSPPPKPAERAAQPPAPRKPAERAAQPQDEKAKRDGKPPAEER